MSRHGRRIAIVGAGFSGTLLAVHLVRHSREGDRVYLLDRDERVGRGLAFASGNPNHLLNVPAAAMSAFGDGTASAQLFALGPVNKGVFWETTAIPDIRLQCERLARHLDAVLRSGRGGAGRAWHKGPGRARGTAGALLKALEAS